MKLSEFKKIKNRQRPEYCYKYVYKDEGKKIEIGTLNGGRTFFLSIENFAIDGITYLLDLWEENFKSVDEALLKLNKL